MLQDEIMKIGEYFQSIEYYGNALIVKVAFPDKWTVYPSNDGLIKPAGGEREGVYFYYGDSDKGVVLEDIFALINDTINTNKSVALKIDMLKDKVEELKTLFSNTSTEDLKRLKFVIEDKPKKPRKKRKTKEEKPQKKEILNESEDKEKEVKEDE